MPRLMFRAPERLEGEKGMDNLAEFVAQRAVVPRVTGRALVYIHVHVAGDPVWPSATTGSRDMLGAICMNDPAKCN